MKIRVGTPLFTIRNSDLECYVVDKVDMTDDGKYSFTLKESRGSTLKVIGSDSMVQSERRSYFEVDMVYGDYHIVFYSPNVTVDDYEMLFLKEFLWVSLGEELEMENRYDDDIFLKLQNSDGVPITFYVERSSIRYVNYIRPRMFVITSVFGKIDILEKEVKGILCDPDEEGNIYFLDGSFTPATLMFSSVFSDKGTAEIMLSAMKRSVDTLNVSSDVIDGFFEDEPDYLISGNDLEDYSFFD